jgi:hypothetical protein
MAGQGEESYEDRFDTVSYSGNNGSLDWSGPWSEVGENDGPASGQIRVGPGNCTEGNCLIIEGGLLADLAVRRAADLSGFLNARLSFDLRIDPALPTSTLHAEVRGNGVGWTTVKSYGLLSSGSHFDSFDVGAYIGPDFEIRFRVTGLLTEDTVSIDNVLVKGEVALPVTTTTSTTTSTSTTSASSPTSTTSSSTTTATAAASGTTTSTAPSTSTTIPVRSPSTTTTEEGPGGDASSTTTTALFGAAPTDPGSGGAPPLTPPPDNGLVDTRLGVLAGSQPDLTGDMDMTEVAILGVDLSAGFSLAVEVFKAIRLWIAILALLIAAAIVSGMDRNDRGLRLSKPRRRGQSAWRFR